MEELSPIFPNLKLEKVKKGRSIDKLIFTWGNRNFLNGINEETKKYFDGLSTRLENGTEKEQSNAKGEIAGIVIAGIVGLIL